MAEAQSFVAADETVRPGRPTRLGSSAGRRAPHVSGAHSEPGKAHRKRPKRADRPSMNVGVDDSPADIPPMTRSLTAVAFRTSARFAAHGPCRRRRALPSSSRAHEESRARITFPACPRLPACPPTWQGQHLGNARRHRRLSADGVQIHHPTVGHRTPNAERRTATGDRRLTTDDGSSDLATS